MNLTAGWLEPVQGGLLAHHAVQDDSDDLMSYTWTCNKRGFWLRPIDRNRFVSDKSELPKWCELCPRCVKLAIRHKP